MKIIANEDLSLYLDTFSSYGIGVELLEDGRYLLNLPEKTRVIKGVLDLEDLSNSDDTFPLTYMFYERKDETLSDFVVIKNKIVATSKFTDIDEDTYSCENLRVYSNPAITTTNFRLSTEIDIADFYHFIEIMLEDSRKGQLLNK